MRQRQYLHIDAAGRASFIELPEQSVNKNSERVLVTTPESKSAWVHEVFESISDDYDRMNDVESFRMHRSWKQTLVMEVLQSVDEMLADAMLGDASSTEGMGVTPVILDVACGSGDIVLALASLMPEAKVVGLDFSENMLAVAKRRAADAIAADADTTLPEFMHGNAMHLPFADNSIDVLTISFGLRNLPDYQAALIEFARVLRPGGSFFCLESSYPTSPVIKPFFKVYFRHLMPRMASLVVGHRQQYQWLNDSTEVFLSKSELADMMQECGFIEIGIQSFFFGVAAIHSGRLPVQQAG